MFLIWQLQSRLATDGGPIYKETILGRFPVEPFNSVSNLFFLLLILYFFLKIKPNFGQHKFLLFTLILTFVGFVGGTLYHATRSSVIWLIMDWLPIVLLCLSAAIYFLYQSIGVWWKVILIFVGLLLLNALLRQLPMHNALKISFGYLFTAIFVVVPLLMYSYKNQWIHAQWIVYAILSFGIALFFRSVDKQEIALLPMGTHWLWHCFGAVAVFCLFNYIFLMNTLVKQTKD